MTKTNVQDLARIALDNLEDIFETHRQDLIECLTKERYSQVHRAEEDFQIARAVLTECRGLLVAIMESRASVDDLIAHQTQHLIRHQDSRQEPWKMTALQQSIQILQDLAK